MADSSADDGVDQFVKDNKEAVDKIIQFESEADSLTGEADSFRCQAAGYIVQLLETGATERVVARAIGKSDSHVHHAKVAWLMMQGDTSISDFNTAYKLAKRPPAQRADDSAQANTDLPSEPESAENSFPPWSKQVRELKRLTAEMIEQASFRQVKSLSNILEKALRAALSKEQDLESAESMTEGS